MGTEIRQSVKLSSNDIERARDAGGCAVAGEDGLVPTSPPAARATRRVSRRVQLARRRAVALALVVLLLGGTGTAVALMAGGDPAPASTGPGSTAPANTAPASPAAAPGDSSQTPSPTPTPEPGVCDDPAVLAALADGTDGEVVAAAGGGAAFRSAVAAGDAACIDLFDAGRAWVVVNKRNPLDPLDYWPTPQAQPKKLRIVGGNGWLRADVAAALDELAAAIVADGAGRVGISSAFRPYRYQVDLYSGYVSSRGRAAADLRSARPGHSEHQTGLAVDVVACDSGCGTHDGFRGTSQARWLVDNAWRFGFVVRYEDGQTDITGYTWEPWHLRFIGVELATVYREGDFHSLEEFFGLPAAPDYEH